MDKKAQGISMNVIIIAALALLVLVVLSIIFLGRTSQWSSQTADCVSNGGSCEGAASCTAANGLQHYAPWDAKCAENGEICCIKLSG